MACLDAHLSQLLPTYIFIAHIVHLSDSRSLIPASFNLGKYSWIKFYCRNYSSVFCLMRLLTSILALKKLFSSSVCLTVGSSSGCFKNVVILVGLRSSYAYFSCLNCFTASGYSYSRFQKPCFQWSSFGWYRTVPAPAFALKVSAWRRTWEGLQFWPSSAIGWGWSQGLWVSKRYSSDRSFFCSSIWRLRSPSLSSIFFVCSYRYFVYNCLNIADCTSA